MKVGNRHFLKYAGAEPPRQMRKEQLQKQNAYVAGLTYEKPPDSPDRPSNMDKAAQARPIPDADNPSKISSAAASTPQPSPESQGTSTIPVNPADSGETQAPTSAARVDAPEKDAGRVIQETA
ncbi:MAG: hypothetical protein HY795_09965 [Desulfovibrio sp.]|nr:hypothetical protein [Desulfovibrio sp.]MBI4959627.1 hypothetical protein [Desulfovibrio sp.]